MISYSGQKGSGKTLTMAMMACKDSAHRKIISNIPGLKVPHHRLMRSDMFIKVRDEKKSTSKTERFKLDVNWVFWKEHKGESIYIDEIHGLVPSRDSGSAENKAASKWVAQCRKVLADTGDWRALRKLRKTNNNFFGKYIYDVLAKTPNFYFNSQTTSKVDKDFRDLTDVHVHCDSLLLDDDSLLVFNYFYFGNHKYSAMDVFENELAKPKRAVFVANKYFNMYDRFAITADNPEAV